MTPDHGLLTMTLFAPDASVALMAAIASVALVVTAVAGGILLVQTVVAAIGGDSAPRRRAYAARSTW